LLTSIYTSEALLAYVVLGDGLTEDLRTIRVTYLAATGDTGAVNAFYPAFSPNVVAVGGTTLTLNPDNSYDGEIGWSGSGGGPSQYETEPTYQMLVQNTGYRTIPDVSFLADPSSGAAVYDTYDVSNGDPWDEAGGTSLATPCLAGLMALVNQGRVAAGSQIFNDSNPAEILNALYSAPSSDFHDDLGGSNGTSKTGLLDPSRYDMVTGLGSPIANLLVPYLINWKALSFSTDSLPESTVGVDYNQTISASGGSGSLNVTYKVTSGTIPTGLNFNAANNQLVISGTPTESGTVDFDVTVTDSIGYSFTQSYTLTINPAVSITPDSIPEGTVDEDYGEIIAASGGTGNVSVGFEITAGSIPSGLDFTVSGNELTIEGIPSFSGSVSFVVTATDAVGAVTQQGYTLTINPASGPVNISSDVSVKRSGFSYNFALHEFVQTITLTNTSSSTLFGSLALQLTSLSSNATLANADGTFEGDPVIDFLSAGQSLAAGQSITVTLYFKDPTLHSITYGTQVWQNLS
jgi:hypothetical protein